MAKGLRLFERGKLPPLENTNPIIMAVEWRKDMRNEEKTGCGVHQTTTENHDPAKQKKTLSTTATDQLVTRRYAPVRNRSDMIKQILRQGCSGTRNFLPEWAASFLDVSTTPPKSHRTDLRSCESLKRNNWFKQLGRKRTTTRAEAYYLMHTLLLKTFSEFSFANRFGSCVPAIVCSSGHLE